MKHYKISGKYGQGNREEESINNSKEKFILKYLLNSVKIKVFSIGFFVDDDYEKNFFQVDKALY